MKQWLSDNWLALAGVALAGVSLLWQYVGERIQARVDIRRSTDDPEVVIVEAVNESRRRTFQVKAVDIERSDGVTYNIKTRRWRNLDESVTPPGHIFQARPPIQELAKDGFPLPMKARGVIRIGTGKKSIGAAGRTWSENIRERWAVSGGGAGGDWIQHRAR